MKINGRQNFSNKLHKLINQMNLKKAYDILFFYANLGTSEDRCASWQANGRSPPSTHVLVAFRLNAPLSSLDPNLLRLFIVVSVYL